MKALLVNADDGTGGAARAAFRLHQGLQSLDVQVQLLVQKKTTDYSSVVGPKPFLGYWPGELRPHLDALPVCWYPRRSGELFSTAMLPGKFLRRAAIYQPDIVNLHWVCNGFFRLESLRSINLPIVWTLHDSWPFTGGCHLPGDCRRYQKSCGSCPVLGSQSENDLSRWIWRRKNNVFRELDLTIVTPSRWLAERAAASSLFGARSIEVIPNGLDCQCFRPLDKCYARNILNLPQDKRLLLFSGAHAATDRNKGFDLLNETLKHFRAGNQGGEVELVIAGASDQAEGADCGFKTHFLGNMRDEVSLCLAYSSSDVLILPSRQENLPFTVMEAMACGLPCVAFAVGGNSELIDHGENGYLARPYETCDLSTGISWILADDERRQKLSEQARLKIANYYELKNVAHRYRDLYLHLVK